MNNTLNILSIDFDFFQKVPKETILQCFPDGHDFNIPLSNVIWISHYANEREWSKLLKIKASTKQIAHIRKIIKNNAKNGKPDAMIANSHKHIYDFIAAHHPTRYNKVHIVNIDMHHDMFNDNQSISCDNWATHVINEIPNVQFTWIAHGISEELFPISNTNLTIKIEDFTELEQPHWDLVFLCRSDLWTPPHLDQKFTSLAKTIMQTSAECQYEPEVLNPRYNATFIENVMNMRKTYEELKYGQPASR